MCTCALATEKRLVLHRTHGMEASVAVFVQRHPGREWRRPFTAPSCETGEGL